MKALLVAMTLLSPNTDFNDALDWHHADIEGWARTVVEQGWTSRYSPYGSEPENTRVTIEATHAGPDGCALVRVTIAPMFVDVSKPIYGRMLPKVEERSAVKKICVSVAQ